MPTKGKTAKVLLIVAVAGLAFRTAGAQSTKSKTAPAGTSDTPDVAKTLKAAADALGMPRIGGAGGGRLPEVDAVNRMEFWGSGTSYALGQASKPGGPRTAQRTKSPFALGYN